jgi:hypothetical protein
MENLDFGWEFGVIMILLYGVVYYLIATVNYLLTILLGRQIKKITDKSFGTDKKNILTTALPFLISATLIFWTIIKLSFIPINKTNSPYNVPGGILFWEPYFYYLTGFIGYIIGLTCLSLTRYSFTTDWTVIGRLKNKRTIFNFIIWTTFALVLTFICKEFLTFWFAYPVLTILTTYLFLKWRNINRPTTDTQTE